MADIKEDGERLFFSEVHPDVKSPETAKFISESESKNGLSPIRVDHVKATFTGLTKEELLKYANDPFWVRTRWILFIFFWVVWICMLLGAVFIIVVTPKCIELQPSIWYRRSPMYVVDVGMLHDQNSRAENDTPVIGILKNRIDYLENLGVESLLVKNVFQSNRGTYDQVTNLTNVNYYLNSSAVFQKEIVKYAESKGIHIILNFVPNFSGKNEWFIKSAQLEPGYEDFYVWYPIKYPEKPTQPPNNWLSVLNGSAWEWHDQRKQFYLHQFASSQPDFNFRNKTLVNMFDDILKYWLHMGIKGFFMENAEYLVEDDKWRDEQHGSTPGYNMNEYEFLSHHRTADQPETKEILKYWSILIRNNSAILGVSGGIQEDKWIAEFIMRPVTFPSTLSAKELQQTISRWINRTEQPLWEWKCVEGNGKCIPASALDGLMIVSFLLPGTPILKQGLELFSTANEDEISLNDRTFNELRMNATSDEESRLNTIKKLIKLRSQPSLMYGAYNSSIFPENVFVFTRITNGSPGYVIAWNLDNNETIVHLSNSLPIIPEDVIVVVRSGHVFTDELGLRKKVSSSRVKIPSMAAIVFSFVPISN